MNLGKITISWDLNLDAWGNSVIRAILFTIGKTESLKHSEDLVKELQNRVDSEIIFVSNENGLKLDVKEKTNETHTKSDYENYSSEVDAHFEDSAYKNIHDIIKRRELFIRAHNAELQEFLEKLNLKIMSELTQKIPNIIEWDEFSGQPKPKKYYTQYLKSEVGLFVQFRYDNHYGKRSPFSLNIGQNGIWKELVLTHPLVASDDDTEIKEIREMIIKNFNAAINSEWFKILKLYIDDIIEDHNHIKEEISKIIKDVKRGIPLKGKCG